MNDISEGIAEFLGSVWVIIPFGIWTVLHAFITKDYVDTISDLAIEIGLLILRAENVQGKRMENQNKRILKRVKHK